MNFTREPVIETIISAKDGYKLAIKSTKLIGQEEYLVDVVEVVSFGGTYFYRSQERPKAFFLPINDYEILEVREARLIVKQPAIEKVKIGGGKESSKQRSESKQESKQEQKQDHKQEQTRETKLETKQEENQGDKPSSPEAQEKKAEHTGEKKRSRRSKKSDQRDSRRHKQEPKEDKSVAQAPSEAPVRSVFSHLLQPPENLISESLKKYKRADGIHPPTDEPSTELTETQKEILISITETTQSEPFTEMEKDHSWDRYIHEPLLSNPFETESGSEIYTFTESTKDADFPEDRE